MGSPPPPTRVSKSPAAALAALTHPHTVIMHARRKRRFILIVLLLAAVAGAVTLTLLALRENINLFYDPTQVVAGAVPAGQYFRIGGMVVADSVRREPNSLQVRFTVTDYAHAVTVQYRGILPDLFREGQGIVAQGRMQDDIFIAEQVLAKHDETYMAPEVKAALERAQQ